MTPPGTDWRAWLYRAAVALLSVSIAAVVLLAGIWVTRGFAVLNYTEGVVLGSLAAFEAAGLVGLYPATWAGPPLVLTLYPPLYFWIAAAVESLLQPVDPLTAPRLVSVVAAIAVGWTLVQFRRTGRGSWGWLVVLAGAAVLGPGVQRQLAAAQVDMLAAAFTAVGVLLVVRSDGREGFAWPALACFVLAVFTKHSFVAAPAALLLTRFRSGPRRRALAEAAAFALTVAAGFAWLDARTAGGFLRHVLGAATDSGASVNLWRVLENGAAWHLAALAGLVLLACRTRMRPAFPEAWLVLASVVHVGAMWKTGASANYLLEPTLALVVTGLVRAPEREDVVRGRLVQAFLGLLLVSSGIRFQGVARDVRPTAGAARIRMAEFGPGHPLVEVDFFPALFEHGGRPYLNDPFAFGGLAESGAWDPSGLAGDLGAAKVPFVLTTIDVRPGLEDGAGTEDALFAYFWRMPAVRLGLLAAYEESGDGLLHVWLPADEMDEGD